MGALLIALSACTPDWERSADTTGFQTATSDSVPTEVAAQVISTPTAALAPALTRIPYRLQPGELLLAAPDDAIPALFASDSLFVSAGAGSREWQPQEPVIGLALGDQARAYPVRLLSQHEIVNDVVGGVPVAVTWCPLCYSAIVFDRRVAGVARTFGVSGYLLKSNLVMYDHQTNTLWSQLLAQAIRGADSGAFLQLHPAQLTTYAAWSEAFPDTRVLSATRLGREADSVIDPYAGYYQSGVPGLLAESGGDDRLPPKALVVGLTIGREQRAYPVEAVAAAGMIHDRLGEQPILLVYDDALQTVLTYSRRIDGQALTFRREGPGLLLDLQTSSGWQVQTGDAISGELAGRRLQRLPAPLVFWFAWSELHPDSQLYHNLEEN